MRNNDQHLAQQLLDEIGGESLEGSGFEGEIPNPSFDMTSPISPNDKRRHSGTKKERRHVE
jgi:hypothetical protein